MPYPSSHKSLQSLGTPFIELQTIDSTNNYALGRVHAGLALHGMTIFAHQQLAGKGRRGKIWSSEPKSNIAMSIVIEPGSLTIAQQFHFSATIAVSVREFFEKYAGSETKIKWPNDLYWQDRKAGGILIENIVRTAAPESQGQQTNPGIWQWAITGIGINVNQTGFPPELPNAVSLKQITGNYFDPVELAKELCQKTDHYFVELITNGAENILANYLSHLYKKDEKVKLKKDSRVFEAVIKGISPSGKLIVQHQFTEDFGADEIEWVIR